MGKRRIRVGILGLGRAGRNMHGPELALFGDEFEIAAAADTAPDRLENLPSCFDGARLYPSLDAMLADDRVEMVTIATRNADHVPHALAALATGRYVVVDKPIAVSYEQALELKAASERHPGKVFLRHNRRFEPAFNQVREIMASGILGRINTVKVYRHPGYVRRFDWQTLVECKGGMLANWGPHLMDQALQLVGAPVADVWCDLQNNVSGGDADDQVKVLLRGENGRVVDVEISSTTTLPGRLYEVRGDRGMLVVPLEEKTVQLRYLDPKQKLARLEAGADQFPLAYGNPDENLRFIDEEVPIRPTGRTLQRGEVLEPGAAADPTRGYTYQDTMWGYLYRAIVDGEPYPVTVDEGVEVVRVSEWARRVSGYVPHRSALSSPDE